jgi:hypothetical protein
MAATDSKAITPSDRASERSPLLEPLEILLGSREMEARFAEGAFGPGSPAVVNRDGRTSFEWLEGGFFLIQRWSVDHPAAPNGMRLSAPATTARSSSTTSTRAALRAATR